MPRLQTNADVAIKPLHAPAYPVKPSLARHAYWYFQAPGSLSSMTTRGQVYERQPPVEPVREQPATMTASAPHTAQFLVNRTAKGLGPDTYSRRGWTLCSPRNTPSPAGTPALCISALPMYIFAPVQQKHPHRTMTPGRRFANRSHHGTIRWIRRPSPRCPKAPQGHWGRAWTKHPKCPACRPPFCRRTPPQQLERLRSPGLWSQAYRHTPDVWSPHVPLPPTQDVGLGQSEAHPHGAYEMAQQPLPGLPSPPVQIPAEQSP